MIEALVDDLAALPSDERTYNQYQRNGNPNNALRRANLLCYLRRMQERRPRLLLAMEAPGYRGSRLTGVPVTSRKILTEGLPALGLFGTQRGYQNPQDAGFEDIQGEQTATIVWTTLGQLQHVPLIWNTFPLHPHKPGSPRSNRRPRKAETQLGGQFLQRMIEQFAVEQVIAVGNVADETLQGLGITHEKVRHPAQGGKNAFVAGMQAIISDMQ